MVEQDIYWMREALKLAEQAALNAEVPIGAVLVDENNNLIGKGFNSPISHCDPTAHAEILALREAAQVKNNYRLINTTMYVTLEPCVMCVGALAHARVKRVVFGAYEERAGAIQSAFQIIDARKLNHAFTWQGGVLMEESKTLLSQFFKARR